jgi:hypothetical protein
VQTENERFNRMTHEGIFMEKSGNEEIPEKKNKKIGARIKIQPRLKSNIL